MRPAPDRDEQTDAERVEIARRYRESRGRELREIAAGGIEGATASEVEAVGEFDTVPTEAVASVPILGAFLALFIRIRYARRKLPASILLAITPGEVVMLATESTVGGETETRRLDGWSRASINVTAINRRFMRDEVRFAIEGREPLKLFAPRLRMNPWSAEVVRALGGDAPEPMPLD